MIQVLLNILIIGKTLKERGNWKLIKHSRNQLKDFILCRTGMNKLPFLSLPFYWYRNYNHLRKDLRLLWRLQTFGFLFTPGVKQDTKDYLNSYISGGR